MKSTGRMENGGIANGIDSMQALIVALQMIGANLYSSNFHSAGQLIWDEQRKGYGFPVAPILRDMLAGDDVEFL